jgi:endoglucanase
LPDEKAIDFVAELGFEFVCIPTDYRFWTHDFDYFHPHEQVFQYLDQYLIACQARGIQLSLNLHSVLGYCINRNNLECDNL